MVIGPANYSYAWVALVKDMHRNGFAGIHPDAAVRFTEWGTCGVWFSELAKKKLEDQAGLMSSQEFYMPRARHFVAVNFSSAFALASGRSDGCRIEVAPIPWLAGEGNTALSTALSR